MATEHIVVDGSNIATEGRSTPSLSQLESAIVELRKERPTAEVTVVVDATFAHRIDPSELPRFEQAALQGQYVSPPAGAIGRGDAFLLRIAEKVGGVVLSNDSFQEFHGEHEWLFDRDRLLGATPVPGVGWIFIPRTPVRGPRSRVAVRDASRAKERVEKAIAVATKEVVDPIEQQDEVSPRRARSRVVSPKALNDPTTFISFIAEHPLGEELEAEIESFTSHGATVRFDDVLCYVPLAGLGDPAPRSAREVLRKGERKTFVITALDPYRRGVELALPGVGVVSGRPSDEMVAAELILTRPASAASSAQPGAARPRRRSSTVTPVAAPGAVPLPPVAVDRAIGTATPRKRVAKLASGASTAAPRARAAARQSTLAKVAAPTARSQGKARTTVTKSPATKTAPSKVTTRSSATKALLSKAAAPKKSTAKKLPAKAVAAKRAPAVKSSGAARAASLLSSPAKATAQKRTVAKASAAATKVASQPRPVGRPRKRVAE